MTNAEIAAKLRRSCTNHHMFYQDDRKFQVVVRKGDPERRLFLDHHHEVEGFSVLVAYQGSMSKRIVGYSAFYVAERGWVPAEYFSTGDTAAALLAELQKEPPGIARGSQLTASEMARRDRVLNGAETVLQLLREGSFPGKSLDDLVKAREFLNQLVEENDYSAT